MNLSNGDAFTEPQKQELLIELTSFTNGIRTSKCLVDMNCYLATSRPTVDAKHYMYNSPTQGTTAFEKIENKVYVGDPVYYDWGANWDVVKTLVPGKQVQEALQISLATAADGYYFDKYDDKRIWPWRFTMHRRVGSSEQAALMMEFLTDESICDLNGQMADFLQTTGETWINEKHNHHGIDEDYKVYDEDYYDLMPLVWNHGLREHLTNQGFGYGSPFAHQWHQACEDALYDPDRNDGVREKLLLCTPNSHAFMSFNYMLAKLLTPDGTNLVIYASDEYSVVYDTTHNIVFDNFWYFCGFSAKETLTRSKKLPQMSAAEFDYTLGGLREHRAD